MAFQFQLQPCTECGSTPTKTRRPGLGLLRLAVGLAIVVILTLGEVWVIERAPDLSVAVGAAVATDSYLMPSRELERDSPPVAVLH